MDGDEQNSILFHKWFKGTKCINSVFNVGKRCENEYKYKQVGSSKSAWPGRNMPINKTII